MALKFNCEHCGKEVLCHFLKIGEDAQCKSCNNSITIPESAEYIEVPLSIPNIPINQSDVLLYFEQRERTRDEILKSPSVKFVKGVLDAVWYIGIVFITLTVIGELFLGPNSTFYSDPTLELPIRIRYDIPTELQSWEDAKDYNRGDGIVLIGHNYGIYKMPGGFWPSSVVIDMLVSAMFVMGATYFLRRMFRSILKGNPFSKKNSMDLRIVGYIIALWGPIYGTLNFTQGGYYLPWLQLANAQTSVELHWYPKLIIVGMVIVSISHMFEIASRMQHENELTI